MFQSIIQFSLKFFANLFLKKYKPKVIAITGSFGKTSTKEAVASALKGKFKVRESYKNYNNELGVPLTILGQKSAGKNFFKWKLIFWKACWDLCFKKDYPEILILEIAADKPGDIQYLTQFIKPDLAILTGLGSSHLEFFGGKEALAKEKLTLLKAVKKDEVVVLNPELVKDAPGLEIKENRVVIDNKTEKTLLTYGFEESQEVQAQNFHYNSLEKGVGFEVKFQNQHAPVNLSKVHSKHQINAALAGIACGLVFKMDLQSIVSSVEKFDSPLGRMNLIPGIKHSWILDDTYNASPEAACAALESLQALASGRRKVFILGDMLELGAYTEEGHRKVGRKAVQIGVDLLLTVGDRANFAADEARKMGLPAEKNKEFDHKEDLMKVLEKYIQPNDLILIKGSQGARMEKVVEDIMAEPMRAKELLVRQEQDWLGK